MWLIVGFGQRCLARAAAEIRCEATLSPSMQWLPFCRRVNDQRVVDRADVAVREVDRVVADIQRDEVRDVHGAAEELDAVVIVL